MSWRVAYSIINEMLRGGLMTLIGILLLVLLLYYFAGGPFVRQATYPAPAIRVPRVPPAQIKSIVLKTADGNSIAGWLHQAAPHPQAPIVIYFHGNGENLQTLWQSDLFSEWEQLSTICLAIDYPGYGLSTGKPSEKSIYNASHAALVWAKQNFPDSPIFIAGWSLGAAVAVQAAAEESQRIDALILLSGWSSLTDIAEQHYPAWMVRLLLKEKYNAIEHAKKVTAPTLVLHGQNDPLIPISQGQQVALEIAGPCRWVPIANAGHNDLFNHREVWNEIGNFLSEVLAGNAAHHG